MLFHSLLLLLAAAILHATTNAFLKQARDKLAFSWWMMGAFSILAFPAWFFVPRVGGMAWSLVIISGTLEAIYFYTLARAYTHGDLSVVYPIARGSAQFFLLFWAMIFLRERPSFWGIVGIVAIVCGISLINLTSLSDWKRPLQGFKTPAAGWALITGFLISSYTAVDKVGVRYFPPFLYLYFILFVCWVLLSVQWLFANRRVALLGEIAKTDSDPAARKKRIATIFASAVLGTVAYLLVLAAMTVSPVSYVGPVREVSVVFGAWIGIRLMKEQGGTLRIAASVLVAAGILMIALRG